MQKIPGLFILFSLFVSLALTATAAKEGRAATGHLRLFSVSGLAPTAIAVDRHENLYVAEAAGNRVRIFDKAGVPGRILTGLARPVSVAVDGNGNIYVGNEGNGSVTVHDSSLQLIRSLGDGEGEFLKPVSIAVTSEGTIYVADAKEDLVKVYDGDGNRSFSFGGSGNSDGLFHYPTAVAVDEEAGEVIVSDLQVIESGGMYPGPHEGARIQVFDVSGRFLAAFGEFGIAESALIKPLGMTLDLDGRIMVADAYQNVVQIYDRSGLHVDTVHDQEHPLRTALDVTQGGITSRLFIVSQRAGSVEVYGEPIPHLITAAAGQGGTISPAGENIVYQGGNQTFRILPEAGYEVDTVLVDGVDIGPRQEYTFFTVMEDHSIEARFSARTYMVTASAGQGGSVSPVGRLEASHGSSMSFTIDAAEGYKTIDVLVDGDSKGVIKEYTFTDITADHTIRALFALLAPDRYTLFVEVSGSGEVRSVPAGIDCSENCSALFETGARVSLVATSMEGWRLSGWSGDCNGSDAGCDLVMDGNKTVRALFTPIATAEGFELGDFSRYPWITGGKGHWLLQSDIKRSGSYAAQAPVMTGGGMSFLEVSLKEVEAGEITFWSRLAAGQESNELRFLVDGVEQNVWSAAHDWREATVTVAGGDHVLRWEYTGAEGGAWLDDISFPAHAAPRFPVPDLKVNLKDGPAALAADELLSLTCALAAGDQEDVYSDWFILLSSPWGWYSYNGFTGTWTHGFRLSWLGPLSDLFGHVPLLNVTGLPSGDYTFFFVIDTTMNGRLDQPFFYDVVQTKIK